ncbi:hypothetical protein PINS_up014133 [Pythium insidiosum]|nr:hypothetical protein PINS_up014133 [Pythium insidiosum]
MSPAQFTAVLSSIPGVGALTVERYPSAVGIGFTWMVLFQDRASPTVATLAIQFVGPTPAGATVTIVSSASTTSQFAGSFRLQFGETCRELTIGGVCVPAVTPALPFNVAASQLQNELSLLPEMSPSVLVSRITSIAGWKYEWTVTIPASDVDSDTPLLDINATALGGNSVIATVTRLQRGLGIAGGQVAVEVSSNGQDYSSSGVVFQYTPTPEVRELRPAHGPLTGGTEVLVVGSNFQNTSALRCRFGSSVVLAATFIDSTLLTCISPTAAQSGEVFVEIANHGAPFKGSNVPFTTSRQRFTYDEPLSITGCLSVSRTDYRELVGGAIGRPVPRDGLYSLQVWRRRRRRRST